MAFPSKPTILCVDDEPFVLEGLRDSLRHVFDVRVAESGAVGLAMLRADRHGYAVVLSDMRMPGMSGADFLAEARRVAPRVVRMLLTGYADSESAARAVNDGQIFRYLSKPCDHDELMRACNAALWQHRLLETERTLLEETLSGSVQALTDVLALASPAAFGRGGRVRRLVTALAAEVGLHETWEAEVAAMLAEVGAVTLPEATAEKLATGAPLTAAEQEMVDRVPAVTQRIVANIPRLEGVQQILAGYGRPFDCGDALPLGARLLRIATDYDVLRSRDLAPAAALAELGERTGVYDPELLDALGRLARGVDRPRAAREVAVAELAVGMMLTEDVRAVSGHLLVTRGQAVTPEILDRLRHLPPGHVREPLLAMPRGAA